MVSNLSFSCMPLRQFGLTVAFWLMSSVAHAGFAIQGFELVHTVPVGTDLQTADLRAPGEVWRELFDGARERIDIEQFYVADQAGSVMDKVIEALALPVSVGCRYAFFSRRKV